MSIFHSQPIRNVPASRVASLVPLLVRLFLQLAGCLAATVPPGWILAHYMMPPIIRLCAVGDTLGFLGFVLFELWILTLINMWRHVWWDLQLPYAVKVQTGLTSEPGLAEITPEI